MRKRKVKVIGIYNIINNVNNKKYIGSSIDIERRLYVHKSLLKNNKHINKHLQNAVNKYGLENFDFKIIEICDKDILAEREQYHVNNFGHYNITKDVIRNTPSEESRIKMSNTRKRLHSLNLLPKTTKSILQYDLHGNFIKKWDSINEASRSLNIAATTIIRVLDGTYKQGRSYIWRYSTDTIIPDNIDFTKKSNGVNTRSRKVILTSIIDSNDVLTFDSIKLASKYFNVSYNNFVQYCRKNIKFKRIYKIDLVKLGEFRETPEVDNPELSL